MSEQSLDEFQYRYPSNVFGHVPGAHNGTSLGTGDRFAGFADLFDYPDPRRLDIRASMRGNMGEASVNAGQRWLVRRYQQRSSVTLWLLSDLSQSVTMASPNNERLARLAHLIAHSAMGIGDKFAMAGFDSQWRQDVSVMPTRQKSMSMIAADMIRQAGPAKTPGVDGILHAANMITNSHALVFIASDFFCDLELLDKTLRKLAHYTVVPIVWKHQDVDIFPSHAGWTEVQDAETGQRRSVWMRPSMKKRWQESIEQHFDNLTACFTRNRVQPLFAEGDVTGEQLTRYFSGLKRA